MGDGGREGEAQVGVVIRVQVSDLTLIFSIYFYFDAVSLV